MRCLSVLSSVALALVFAACGDSEVSNPSTDAAVDAGTELPVLPAFDTWAPPGDGGPGSDSSAPGDGVTTTDGAGPDIVADTGPPEEGGTGWPCTSNADCNSEFCLGMDEGDAGYCTELCQTECPFGYVCQNQPQIGDVVFLCVKVDPTTCVKQCTNPGTFKGCGVPGALCADVDGEAWCLDRCLDDGHCPSDFACTEMTDGDGFPLGKQCWPNSGSCACGTDIDIFSDPDHCGECGHACEYDNATPRCDGGVCVLGPCNPGFTNLNGQTQDGCEYPCQPTSDDDLPDPDGDDANCDGIDGERDRAVFVSPDGVDEDNDEGAIDAPFRTINAGIVFASAQVPKRMVLVAEGAYLEQVRVKDGVTLAGGYDPSTWRRDPSVHETIVIVDQIEPSGAIRALIADGITADTLITGLTIRTTNNPTPGGASQAIWSRNSGPGLVILGNRIEPGDGGIGTSGTPGITGNDGVDGQPGETGGPENWWNPQITIQGGAGSENPCASGSDAGGGAGGAAGWGDNPTFDSDRPAHPGVEAPGGADGGYAGPKKNVGGTGDNGDDGNPRPSKKRS